MYEINHPERIKLNNQIKEWNANRLDLFQISEPNDYLEFYGVMRYFFQGDDLKYQTKCLRVSSSATTLDVIEALVVKFHPDLKMLNNDKYALYESHNIDDRRMKNGEHPLIVQLNWALDDKDGKFILKNDTRRRRSIDLANHTHLSNYALSRSTTTLANGFDNQAVRTQSSTDFRRSSKFFSKRFKSKRKSKGEKEAFQDAENEKRFADEISGKPPESSFTRTISNPDDVMKRRRQKKLESRLEQFSGVKGDGETGGTLKIYGDSINPDIPYKTLLLSVNDTAEKVLAETLDKYGLSAEDHRFYVLVQQNIPPRNDKNRAIGSRKNRGNMEEIILHEQDCPLGILVHCPPVKGSATFAVRRATPLDQFPTSPKMPPFSFSSGRIKNTPNDNINRPEANQDSLSPSSPVHRDTKSIVEYPRLRKLIVDVDGSLYDEDNGMFSLSSLVNVNQSNMFPNEGSKFIKIGSQLSSVGDYPNILLSSEFHDDIRPVHCHISAKIDLQTNSMKLQLTPTLDSSSRTPKPCVMFINQQRVDCSTRMVNGDMIQLGETVIFRFEEFEENESPQNNGFEEEPFDDSSESLEISYFTADLPVTVTYKYKKSQDLVDNIIRLSKEYTDKGCKELFSSNSKFDMNNLDETFRLAPAYMMYMVIRAGLANDQYIIQLIDFIANRIDRVVQENRFNVEKEVFWLSNISELLHILQYDNDLKHYSGTAQDVLASAIEHSFSIVQQQFSQDLMVLLPSLLSEDDTDINDNTQEDNIPCLDRASVLIRYGSIDYPIQHLLQTLSLAFNLFHNCQVNVALTIQMFSQLFHLVNTWVFNSVLGQPSDKNGDNEYSLPVCREWGNRLTRRLNRIRYWSEINGLEMAANCHLQKMYQVAELMEADKRDLNIFGEKCLEMVNLNGAQLHQLLTNCQDYDLPDPWVDVVVNTAIQLNDQSFNNNTGSTILHNKNTLPLYEDMDLRLPLLLPADGYCCDRGIASCPIDLKTMLRSLKGILKFRLNPPTLVQIDTRWKSYLGICENTPTVSRSNTGIEPPLITPGKSDAPYLPRNWINNPVSSEGASLSENISSKRERFKKKSNNSLHSSQNSNSQLQLSLPNLDKSVRRQSSDFDQEPKKQSRFDLKLSKIDNSLGLSIIAAKASVNDIYRIYVKDVITGGAGYKCGKISSGDQLVSIDGIPLKNMTQDEAVSLMKRTKSVVILQIEKEAAQKHGVMDMITEARKSKISSSNQKSRHVSNTQTPTIKKALSKSNPPLKRYPSKEEHNVTSHRSQFVLPSPPKETAPPRPPRVVPSNNLKTTHNKVNSSEFDYNSLPVRKNKAKEAPLPEIPIYATVKKKPLTKPNNEIKPYSQQKTDSKPFKSKSFPNLYNMIPDSKKQSQNPSLHSSSSGSSFSCSATSSDEEKPLKSYPQSKITTNYPKRSSASDIRVSQKNQPTIARKTPDVDASIPIKNLGIPRHNITSNETEQQTGGPKRHFFSRPVVTENSDLSINLTSQDETEPLSLNKPVPMKSKKTRRKSSSSSTETISSNTRTISSSDQSPQPQEKMNQESAPVILRNNSANQKEIKTGSNQISLIPERKPSTGTPNLGGFKKPVRPTNFKPNEPLKNNLSIKETFHSPKIFSKSKSVDDDEHSLSPIQVKSYSPFTMVPPPPVPTASYPQYHPPTTLDINYQNSDKKFEPLKPPSAEELKLRKKEMTEKIRRQTEKNENKIKSDESVSNEMTPAISTEQNNSKRKGSTSYGRPQFNENNPLNRPGSLNKHELNDTNTSKFPSLPSTDLDEGSIVITPPRLQSQVIGSNEIYKDPRDKINRTSEIESSQEGVEELPFREKMKLFAAKVGDENVVERKKFGSKQQKINSGDYS